MLFLLIAFAISLMLGVRYPQDRTAEEIESKYNDVNYSDLEKAHSLMINRITRIKEELKVYSKLIQKIDDKMEKLS